MWPAKPQTVTMWTFSENVKKKLLYQVHKIARDENLLSAKGLIQSRSFKPDCPSPEETKTPIIF